MNPAGYSDKSLIEKLGYSPGEKVYLFNAPEDFKNYLEENRVIVSNDLPTHWVHGFFRAKIELAIFLDMKVVEKSQKGVWVSWPKKTSGVQTYLTEQTFRDYLLPLGWVDTKVTAIDDTWSGLKFLRRKS